MKPRSPPASSAPSSAKGRWTCLALLDAERTFAEAEAELAKINGQVASAQINLFRALGGGWSA